MTAKPITDSSGLSAPQVEALLRPINARRVLRDNKGMAHVSQQDVRAHLTRIFGFGGWSSEVVDLTLVREAPGIGKDGKDKGWAVTYRATVRLSVRDPQGRPVASYEDVATGTSPNLPTVGDAHDFACKVAVSMALKRCATNLGDGFGLSLYNKGQMSALVIDTLVKPDGTGANAEDRVPQQESMGHDDAGSAESEPERKAERGSAESDPWAQHPVAQPPTTDAGWVKTWEGILADAQSQDAFQVAWKALGTGVQDGKVAPADADGCKLLWKEALELWRDNDAKRVERQPAGAA